MPIPRVYSYLRFSDPKQAAGGSVDRQLQYAKKWAKEHSFELDESLTLRDEGLSAFHQKHVKQGALGTFLAAIMEGKIPTGSVLVVEGLDRLSRAEPIQAQAQLAQIVNAGITVVTASDGREYNREKLKSTPMDLVYSLLVMIRAHEESDTKSKRVKAAIRRQCQAWIAGAFRGKIQVGNDPDWVEWNGTEFIIVPKYADAVKLAIKMFKDGNGALRTIRKLEEQGLQLNKGYSYPRNLYRMLKRKDLIGTRTITIDGEQFDLDGYYPRLLSDSEYAELTAANSSRVKRKGRGEIPGIVSGIGILYCGYCGSAVSGQNAMGRMRREDGTLNQGHRRLQCCGAVNGGRCVVPGSVSVVPVEKALLSYCSDQFNLSALMGGNDKEQLLRDQLHTIISKTAEMEHQLERITEAMLSDKESAPQIFLRKARELETEITKSKQQQSNTELELRKASTRQSPDMAAAWSAIVEGTLKLDYDIRMKCRKLVQETFERIVIYHSSTDPTGSSNDKVDLLLIAKGGRPRLLRIHRKTGDWLAGEEGGM